MRIALNNGCRYAMDAEYLSGAVAFSIALRLLGGDYIFGSELMVHSGAHDNVFIKSARDKRASYVSVEDLTVGSLAEKQGFDLRGRVCRDGELDAKTKRIFDLL